MELRCPHCGFSSDVEPAELPQTPPLQVHCPRCRNSFILPAAAEPATATVASASPPPPPPLVAAAPPAPLPGGFWRRLLAALLDGLLSSVAQFALVAALRLVIELGTLHSNGGTELLLMLGGTLVSLAYYVFFTGYNGQTPGKMVLGLQVVADDGGPVGYGRAFWRETLGKFLSSILLLVGYLMVAIRADKRGLHDLIAGTRVIRC